MKKYVFYGILAAFAVAVLVAIFASEPSTPTIKSDVFNIREWNNTEYIEKWTSTVQGTVVKEMTAKSENEYNCLIECEGGLNGKPYLVYYIDKVKHPVGEVTEELSGVMIGSYNYEEDIDNVRQLAVFLSMDIVEEYQKRKAEQ